MTRNIVACVSGVAGLCLASSAQALFIFPTADANTLASTISGSGVILSNITYTGAGDAAGTFTDGLTSGIGMDAGIILTTGFAGNAIGGNISDNISWSSGLPGDASLNAFVSPVLTYDASILEFDFFTAGGNLVVNYVFGSDEYISAFASDVIGFFLDGANIALVPGTSNPVNVASVNETTNSSYFNNNYPPIFAPFDLEYDGFTDVFTASALNLAPGLHHMKIAIADTGDDFVDSGVFIQARSFAVPEPSVIMLMALGLAGFSMMRRRIE